MIQLAPSILSADFSRLGAHLAEAERGGAGLVHVDVMDGHFVPNISFGAAVMKCLEGQTKLPFDVHLMIEDPDKYLEDFVTGQTEYITVHQEACRHLDRTIEHIKSAGVKAGVALNPATPLNSLDAILPQVDLVLIMSVNPGFGGQKLIPYTLEKIKELKERRLAGSMAFKIEIDGGVNLENAGEAAKAGVDIIVAGSSVFGKEDAEKQAKKFTDIFSKM